MSRRANGEGSIYPYRNGFAAHVWITTPAGRRQRKSVYGKTRAEVHEKWLRLHEQARRGPVVPISPKLRDFLEQWLTETVRPGLSPATASNYEMFSRLYIVPDLEDRELEKLSVRDVQTWVNELRVRCQCCFQNKVALHCLDDGGWGVSQDATPTTHILKPTRAGTRFENLHVNEFVCLRAAGLLGLRVASVDLVDVGGAKTLVSTRYDRGRGRDGVWLRLHQEDLLQAMSYPPTKKYQSDGGPSVKNVASLLSTLALADRDAVRSAFFDAFAFNVLVGGTDAHAKNYCLLLRGPRVALAPLCDVASYAPYLKRGEAVRSSMKAGRTWHVRDATVEDWLAVGLSLGLDATQAVDRVERLRTCLPEAVLAAA